MDAIPLLVEYLIDRYAKKAGKKFRDVTSETLDLFRAYEWPGKIRELQNIVERAVILRNGETFSIDETWLKRESPPGPSLRPFGAAHKLSNCPEYGKVVASQPQAISAFPNGLSVALRNVCDAEN